MNCVDFQVYTSVRDIVDEPAIYTTAADIRRQVDIQLINVIRRHIPSVVNLLRLHMETAMWDTEIIWEQT